jgi:radical SAM superfamily enzyme YgiQ (UPF0313 family)
MIPKISSLGVDFINLSTLTPYPGTRLFEEEKKNILFTLKPFRASFNDVENVEKGFFFRYYLRPANALRLLFFMLKYPIRSFELFFDLAFMRNRNLERLDFI